MIDDSSDDEEEQALRDPDDQDEPNPGPTPWDLGLVGASMLGSLVLFSLGFVFLREANDRSDSIDTVHDKASLCRKPVAVATATGKPTSAGLTKTFDEGEEPPLLVELRSYVDGKTSYVRLGAPEVLPTKEVTVMNLWATWCKPCVNELPALRALFERHSDWSGKAMFLPVLTEDPSSTDTAYRDFKSAMPPFRRFLVEFGGFTDSLEKKQMWRKDLPVTFVIGCRQRIRWMHFGELDPPKIAEMEATVSKLIAELDSAECKKDVAACGDGRCNGMENKVSCKLDCPAGMVLCGDGVCDGPNENKENCPQDCGLAKCGDGVCGDGEAFKNCPKDCRGRCPKDFKCKAGFSCDSKGRCMDAMGFPQQ